MVQAGQLSLLMKRPLGVLAVTNPQDAQGGEDRESLDNGRANAPLTILTLDRIVSLEDYQNFAQAFAGIAKALATWTWNGQVRGVFVTVAGTGRNDRRSDRTGLRESARGDATFRGSARPNHRGLLSSGTFPDLRAAGSYARSSNGAAACPGPCRGSFTSDLLVRGAFLRSTGRSERSHGCTSERFWRSGGGGQRPVSIWRRPRVEPDSPGGCAATRPGIGACSGGTAYA